MTAVFVGTDNPGLFGFTEKTVEFIGGNQDVAEGAARLDQSALDSAPDCKGCDAESGGRLGKFVCPAGRFTVLDFHGKSPRTNAF
jgi:hypothetical protein